MPILDDGRVIRDRPGIAAVHAQKPPPSRIGDVTDQLTPETLRLYRGEWARFAEWCRVEKKQALPATPATLAAHLVAAAATIGRPALARRRAAVAAMHRAQDLVPPRLDRAALAAVRASGKTALHRASRAGPRPTPGRLARMAAACPGDLAGLRDRALLLIAAATAGSPRLGAWNASGDGSNGVVAPGVPGVPQSFLLMLDAEHIQFENPSVTLGLRERADETEPSRLVVLGRGAVPAGCPVRALEDWLRVSGTRFGPVFRKVDRWGNVEHGRLGPDALRRIVARRALRPAAPALPTFSSDGSI